MCIWSRNFFKPESDLPKESAKLPPATRPVTPPTAGTGAPHTPDPHLPKPHTPSLEGGRPRCFTP